MKRILVALFVFASFCSHAFEIAPWRFTGETLQIGAVEIQLPGGWRVRQRANDEGRLIFGIGVGNAYIQLFAEAKGARSLESLIADDAEWLRDVRSQWGEFPTKMIHLRAVSKDESPDGYSVLFSFEHQNLHFFGYTTSESEDTSEQLIQTLLSHVRRAQGRSMTGSDFLGKKFYLGWGAAAAGDAQMMHNEVKYDVLHTHDIFTGSYGGTYSGKKLVGTVSASQIRSEWKALQDEMTWDDMYVQYSSGHGHPTGLFVGVSYDEMRDAALRMPAREIIIFTMACRSGGLVDSFNKKKDKWQNWSQVDRTLMVLTSSSVNVDSSTGPGTDPDQPGGPSGSAGSAFGHALWKALIGYADGYSGGVKDNLLTLGEIEKFTKWKTKQVGGHAPVSTGIYSENLVMNRIPPKSFRDQLEGSSEKLTDAQILERIQSLDRELRVEQ